MYDRRQHMNEIDQALEIGQRALMALNNAEKSLGKRIQCVGFARIDIDRRIMRWDV